MNRSFELVGAGLIATGIILALSSALVSRRTTYSAITYSPKFIEDRLRDYEDRPKLINAFLSSWETSTRDTPVALSASLMIAGTFCIIENWVRVGEIFFLALLLTWAIRTLYRIIPETSQWNKDDWIGLLKEERAWVFLLPFISCIIKPWSGFKPNP